MFGWFVAVALAALPSTAAVASPAPSAVSTSYVGVVTGETRVMTFVRRIWFRVYDRCAMGTGEVIIDAGPQPRRHSVKR